VHRLLKSPEQAIRICGDGRAIYPDDPELLFQEALCFQELNRPKDSEACYRRILDTPPTRYFSSTDSGLCGYKTYYNLALLCRDRGASAEAVELLERAIDDAPRFLSALVALAEIMLKQEKWEKVERLLVQIRQTSPSCIEGGMLAARVHSARRAFPEAKKILEDTVARHPKALMPRLFLGHVLLREGISVSAAEEALKGVLELDPFHAETRRNLELLRTQGFAKPTEP
jgi:tetratricopeptide (TPR) repeat protein